MASSAYIILFLTLHISVTKATEAGGGYVGFEAADLILGSAANGKAAAAFFKDKYFYPHYAEFRLFVYVVLERRTEARGFLTSLAMR
jgi:hypothetical protein